MRTLVVTAMTREARAIGDGAVALGAGAGSAENPSIRLRDARPDGIVIAGICGGLDPSLAAGDVILSRSVVAAGCPELAVDRLLLDAARLALAGAGKAAGGRRGTFVTSRLLTVAAPVTSRRDRCELWNMFGAGGVDMETYALAETAQQLGIRWLALRAVSDPAGERLPGVIASWRSEQDDARIARAIAARPWEWPYGLRLAGHTRRALRSLTLATHAVTGVLEQALVPDPGEQPVDDAGPSPALTSPASSI